MTPNKELLADLKLGQSTKVQIGNGEFLEAIGKATVSFNTKRGPKLISNVLHVPKLALSLLSVPRMLESNHILHFEDRMCIISDSEGIELFRVSMRNKSFPLRFEGPELNALSAVVNNSDVWHQRLGHCSYKNTIPNSGLPSINVTNEACDLCQLGKQTKLPFAIGKSRRGSEKLELVHSDVCGPI